MFIKQTTKIPSFSIGYSHYANKDPECFPTHNRKPALRKILSLFTTGLITLFLASNAMRVCAQSNNALIIGNSNYIHITRLANPANDASDFAETIKQMGFRVTLLIDASKPLIEKGVSDFINRLRRDRGIGVFYYAGHGSQLEGTNYIIPVNSEIDSEFEIKSKGYSISYLLSEMNHAKNTTNIIILDACRDNPFAGIFNKKNRSAANDKRGMVKIKAPVLSSGLSKLDAPPNTLIAYSTAPGKVALDGTGRNSPYTKALIDSMQTEGFTIEQVFKEVRTRLIEQTNGAQIPWESSSLVSDYYFKPRKTLPSGW